MSAYITRRSLLAGSAGVALFGSAQPSAAQALPRIVVTKDPSCGCCAGWVEHLRASGFAADVVESAELNRVKARLGVPQELASCHTAEVGGYVVEGHVPADAIKRLLAEKPAAKGLAVPGMPVGSPGMKVEGTAPETYEVVLFGDGKRATFARYRGARAI
jgi:hypothetical protein